MSDLGVFAQRAGASGSNFSAEKYATLGVAYIRERLPYLLALFSKVHQELVHEIEEALERRFDDEVENENKNVDGGEGA